MNGSRSVVRQLFAALSILTAAPAFAGIYPPQSGGSFPPAYYEAIRNNPKAFEFEHAYLRQARQVRENRRMAEQGLLPLSSGAEMAISGNQSIPVLLGKFSNTGADPCSAATLQRQLFTGPWPTGTLTQYYLENSLGAFNVTGTVYNWVTAPQIDTYYEGDSGCNGLPGGCNAKTGEFLKYLLDQNDAAIDFSQYDNDGPDGIPDSGDDDGYVDVVMFVQPEKGGECKGSNNIWSHRSVYSIWYGSAYTTNDSRTGGGYIKVQDYTIQPALSCSGGMIEIGVFCHEYAHVLDLPDLYDGDGSSNGLGVWCLMSGGSWGGNGNIPEVPSHLSAWCKEQLGWLTTTVVSSSLTGASLSQVETGGEAWKIYPTGGGTSEYFLVENRQKTGFDLYLPTGGLAVWHIDNSVYGNDDESHKQVDLEEADGKSELDLLESNGDAGDLFPGTYYRRYFNDTTTPNSRNYEEVPTCMGLAAISNSASVMTANVSPGAGCDLFADDFQVLDDNGNHNRLPDSGERFLLRIGMRNRGDARTNVAAVLTSTTTGVNIIDGTAQFGTIGTGLSYGAEDFEVSLPGGLAAGTRIDFTLDLTADGGYTLTDSFHLNIGGTVLLVDDDEGQSYNLCLSGPITSAGRTCVVWNVATDGEPRTGNLRNTLAVVWETGSATTTTLNFLNREALSTHLDAGGRLFITGQNIGYDLAGTGTAEELAFYNNYLHANYVSNSSSDTGLEGMTGDPIGDGIDPLISGGACANNQTSPDVISARTGASVVFRYSSTKMAGIRWSGAYKVVYFGYGEEAVSTVANRALIMKRILNWLIPTDITPPTMTLTAPNGGSYEACGTPLPVSWSATDGSSGLTVSLYYSTDCGVTYPHLIVSGLAGSGTYNWPTPEEPGAFYRIRGVAIDSVGLWGIDASDTCFVLSAPPPAITLVTPNGGETFTIGVPDTLAWSLEGGCVAPADSVILYISHDGGATWPEFLVSRAAGESTLVTVFTGEPTTELLVKAVCRVGADSTWDVSDAVATLLDSTQTTVGETPLTAGKVPLLLHAYPNPAGPRAVLRFYLPRREAVRLSVFDVAGRRIRTLIDGEVAEGVHEVAWTGRDDTERVAPSGLYFYTLEGAGWRQVRKLTLVH